MAYFTESWLEQLKSNSDIVDAIGKFIYLEKKGQRYWACCPFHHEKTPSFAVNQEEQFYYCFGCGKSGNIFTFLMEHERLTYPEAVEWLAKRVGMSLPEAEESEASRKARAMKEKGLLALKTAARFYLDNLYKAEGQVAIDYINKRGFSSSIIKEFGIGYSLDYDGLPQHLQKAGFDRETMLYAGLISNISDKTIDFQAGRLIIPIINPKGQVIGFGGRTLDDTKQPKYKNTSATKLFDKRRTLFGLNLIKKLQQKEKVNYLILVEGYMDVMCLNNNNIKNSIASMGTALTPEQCQEIKKYTSNVYVSFDADDAGQTATWKSLDLLSDAGIEVKVVSLPKGMDPDDVIVKYGREGYLNFVDKALPLIEFKLHKIAENHQLNTPNGKKKYASSAIEVLAKLDPLAQDIYVNEVSKHSGLSKESLKNSIKVYKAEREDLPSFQKAKTPLPELNKEKEEDTSQEGRSKLIAAQFLLSSTLDKKSYVDIKDLKEEYFSHPSHKIVYEYIMRNAKKKTELKKGDLYDYFPEDTNEAQKIINAVERVNPAQQAKYYEECVEHLSRESREKRRAEILKLLGTTEDEEKKAILQAELRKLTSRNKTQR